MAILFPLLSLTQSSSADFQDRARVLYALELLSVVLAALPAVGDDGVLDLELDEVIAGRADEVGPVEALALAGLRAQAAGGGVIALTDVRSPLPHKGEKRHLEESDNVILYHQINKNFIQIVLTKKRKWEPGSMVFRSLNRPFHDDLLPSSGRV